MALNRRQLLTSLGAGLAGAAVACRGTGADSTATPPVSAPSRPVRLASGEVDWPAVRDLFSLSREWIHLAAFLLASHPKPVADAIDQYRRKIDAEPGWIEDAAFADSEGHPFSNVKKALAYYVGGAPQEICVTSNTTTALAMAYHGLRIRPDQQILTTEHDHYVHHESIRYAAARSGATVSYVALYDDPATATSADMTARLAKAISPHTRAVGVTWVHSGTGVKTPIAAFAEAVKQANRGRADADRCLLIVDGVHGFGNQDVDAARLGLDFFAASNHKWLCGPRGTGFLWGRPDAWPHLRPTIPSFDPEETATWDAWMDRKALPPTEASFVSPGGFVAFEHLLAVMPAVGLHRDIGRDRIAARIHELNTAFREGAKSIKGLTLHTPVDREVSAGLSCFEMAGLKASDVTHRLLAKKIRTSDSPYKVSYARVSAGIMNSPEDVDTVLRALRELAA